MDKNDRQYDLDRLTKQLQKYGNLSVMSIKDKIITDVFSFFDQQRDDITMIVAKKK